MQGVWIALIVLAALCLLYLFLMKPGRRRDISPLAGVDYAHRGLWNEQRPENSLSAFRAAVDAGFGIELDVHVTADDQLVVFHDDSLTRMCGVEGMIAEKTLAELKALSLAGSGETIPTFDEVLAVVDGRVPLIVEIKADKRLALLCEMTRARLAAYPGAYCIESFHPLAVRYFRLHAPDVIRGQLAFGIKGRKATLLNAAIAGLMGNAAGRPDFIAYEAVSAENTAMTLTRMFRPYLVAWTVRSQQDMDAYRSAWDLQIFEGFVPKR